MMNFGGRADNTYTPTPWTSVNAVERPVDDDKETFIIHTTNKIA